jgi:hypothetical protein
MKGERNRFTTVGICEAEGKKENTRKLYEKMQEITTT